MCPRGHCRAHPHLKCSLREHSLKVSKKSYPDFKCCQVPKKILKQRRNLHLSIIEHTFGAKFTYRTNHEGGNDIGIWHAFPVPLVNPFRPRQSQIPPPLHIQSLASLIGDRGVWGVMGSSLVSISPTLPAPHPHPALQGHPAAGLPHPPPHKPAIHSTPRRHFGTLQDICGCEKLVLREMILSWFTPSFCGLFADPTVLSHSVYFSSRLYFSLFLAHNCVPCGSPQEFTAHFWTRVIMNRAK